MVTGLTDISHQDICAFVNLSYVVSQPSDIKTFTLCILVSSSFSLPHSRTEDDERGLFGDILGGLVAGDTTTATPAELTTIATLYGDLVLRTFGFYLSMKINNFCF